MIHHHEFWWRFFPKKELTQLYISLALRTFAISLIGIFLPLYLFSELGYSLNETLMFFIFYAVTFAVVSPLGAKFSSKYGTKHGILFSMPLYLISIILLYALPFANIPLQVIAATLGASQAFFWLGTHLVFHHASHKKKRGTEVGKRDSLKILSAMLGPLIGGGLITLFGFNIVFLVASVLLLLSAFVLFLSKDGHEPYHFSVKSVLNKDHWKDSLFFISRGTQIMSGGVIWPLLIFSILGSYLSLGVVGTLLSGIGAVLVLIVGRTSDNIGKRRIIRWITPFESLSWILRGLVATTFQVYAVTILAAFTNGIREAPLGATEYDKASGEVAAYFVSREMFLCVGRILLLTLVIMTNSLSGGLIFQSFANLAVLLF